MSTFAFDLRIFFFNIKAFFGHILQDVSPKVQIVLALPI